MVVNRIAHLLEDSPQASREPSPSPSRPRPPRIPTEISAHLLGAWVTASRGAVVLERGRVALGSSARSYTLRPLPATWERQATAEGVELESVGLLADRDGAVFVCWLLELDDARLWIRFRDREGALVLDLKLSRV